MNKNQVRLVMKRYECYVLIILKTEHQGLAKGDDVASKHSKDNESRLMDWPLWNYIFFPVKFDIDL